MFNGKRFLKGDLCNVVKTLNWSKEVGIDKLNHNECDYLVKIPG